MAHLDLSLLLLVLSFRHSTCGLVEELGNMSNVQDLDIIVGALPVSSLLVFAVEAFLSNNLRTSKIEATPNSLRRI